MSNRHVPGPCWCGFHHPAHVVTAAPGEVELLLRPAGILPASFSLRRLVDERTEASGFATADEARTYAATAGLTIVDDPERRD